MRLIDADALKEWIDEYVSVFKKSDNKDIKGYIEHQPTIEPKQGEWIEWIDCEGEVFWKCSACGQASEASVAGILYKFCPFCGADMREREGE